MPYVTIGNHAVFLHRARYDSLLKEAMAGKPIEYQYDSGIGGTRAAAEADELMLRLLHAKHQVNPRTFYDEWVKFDLAGKAACEDAWDLLFDYCHFSKCGTLVDYRDELKRLLHDWTGDPLAFPMGKVFAVRFTIPKTGITRFISGGNGPRSISVVINTQRIHRLRGELRHFTLLSADFALECGENIEILPALLNSVSKGQ